MEPHRGLHRLVGNAAKGTHCPGLGSQGRLVGTNEIQEKYKLELTGDGEMQEGRASRQTRVIEF